jgi:hypothetical protein
MFGSCRVHTHQSIDFYCTQCHVPVCVHCKMVGHHSSGDAARHTLLPVMEAYKAVLNEASNVRLHDGISSIDCRRIKGFRHAKASFRRK